MDEELLLLLTLNATNTNYIIVPITTTLIKGKPIGFGKCKAVRFQVPQFLRNSTVASSNPLLGIYYGDEQSQEWELLRGAVTNTSLIVTDRLEKIYIRSQHAFVGYVNVAVFS